MSFSWLMTTSRLFSQIPGTGLLAVVLGSGSCVAPYAARCRLLGLGLALLWRWRCRWSPAALLRPSRRLIIRLCRYGGARPACRCGTPPSSSGAGRYRLALSSAGATTFQLLDRLRRAARPGSGQAHPRTGGNPTATGFPRPRRCESRCGFWVPALVVGVEETPAQYPGNGQFSAAILLPQGRAHRPGHPRLPYAPGRWRPSRRQDSSLRRRPTAISPKAGPGADFRFSAHPVMREWGLPCTRWIGLVWYRWRG